MRRRIGTFSCWVAALTLAAIIAGWLLSTLSEGVTHTRFWRQFAAFLAAFGGWIGIALIGMCAVGTLLVFDALMPDKDTPDKEPDRD